MQNTKHIIIGLILSGCFTFIFSINGLANASPIDLSTWHVQQYPDPGIHPLGKWELSDNNETVTQTVNADPAMYLNGIDQTSYSMDGSWKVNAAPPGGFVDDDFIGFVFGYQDAGNFYMMDWKRYGQTGGSSYVNLGTALEGFSIKKISAGSVSDLQARDFWHSEGTDNSSILASDFSDINGWNFDTLYDFHLDFTPGEFSIAVSANDTEIWNVTVNDSSFTSGQFGFYNFSQPLVEYSGFEQTPIVTPEPASMLLLLSGLVGLGILRSKFHKSIVR
ncbi:PEP-CTERM sorting domain-containing protein [Desulfococcaceae bacterium HSG7]|nr:PEP-CTERM sorting domain-containing protein [Desulfococcaceae bacterium HSG7]